MSEWYDKQKKSNGSFRKLLQERIGKANPPRNLMPEILENNTYAP